MINIYNTNSITKIIQYMFKIRLIGFKFKWYKIKLDDIWIKWDNIIT